MNYWTKWHTSILFALLYFTLNAQTFHLNGTILDENKQPLESCEVIVLLNNIMLANTISDSKGYFFMEVPKGFMDIKVFFLGAEIHTQNLNIVSNTLLGEISVTKTKNLEGVAVVAKKRLVENKVDRTVYNIEYTARSIGSNALQLLKGTPGLLVSANNIDLAGKKSVRVMINDRLVQMTGSDLNNYLMSLNSENIQSIEVITNPPAKYEADGNSGLINIILKKAPANSWSSTVRNVYFQSSHSSWNGGMNFIYNKNKSSFFADMVTRQGATASDEENLTNFGNEIWDSNTRRKDFISILRPTISYDLNITKKTTIGAKYIGFFDRPDIRDRNTTNIIENNQIQQVLKTNGFNDSKTRNQNTNFYIVQKLDTLGKKIMLDVDLFNFKESQNRIFASTSHNTNQNTTQIIENAQNTSDQQIEIKSLRLDSDLPTKIGIFNVGGKLNWIDNNSKIRGFDLSSGTPQIQQNFSNDYFYQENTQALYGSFEKKWSEKWQTKFGVRYEATQTSGISSDVVTNTNSDFTLNYQRWFPSAYVLFQPKENYSISVNYNRRIERPDFWKLNPYTWVFTPFLVFQGNPFLQPTFSSNTEIAFNWKQIITIKAYHTNIESGVLQVPTIDPVTNIANHIYENIYNQNIYGLLLQHNQSITNWWETSNSFNYFNQTPTLTKTTSLDSFRGGSWTLTSYHSFTFNKKQTFFGDITYQFQAPYRSILTQNTRVSQLDFSLRYVIPDSGFTFFLVANDIWRGSQKRFTNIQNQIVYRTSSYHDERMVYMGMFYKFGNKKLSSKSRKTGIEEEKTRIK